MAPSEVVALYRRRQDVVAVTAAMLYPVGLGRFAAAVPDRIFDVGIAEQHALVSAAGLARTGLHPVVALYATFVEQLAKLPEHTQVYPGHEYIENNLKFTLSREPDNVAAQALLPQVQGQDPATSIVTTLSDERRFNTFFRLDSPSLIARLREAFADLPEQPDAQTVFVKLRELRNSW